MVLKETLTKLADTLAGLRTYLVCIALFVYTLVHDRGHYDGNTLINLGFDAVIAALRSVTWKPGALSGAKVYPQPDGGTYIEKPPPTP